jgi:hypothetical protein
VRDFIPQTGGARHQLPGVMRGLRLHGRELDEREIAALAKSGK